MTWERLSSCKLAELKEGMPGVQLVESSEAMRTSKAGGLAMAGRRGT